MVDEGWENKQRDNSTGKIVPGPKFGGSDAGIKALVKKIHGMGLKIGLCLRCTIITVRTLDWLRIAYVLSCRYINT